MPSTDPRSLTSMLQVLVRVPMFVRSSPMIMSMRMHRQTTIVRVDIAVGLGGGETVMECDDGLGHVVGSLGEYSGPRDSRVNSKCLPLPPESRMPKMKEKSLLNPRVIDWSAQWKQGGIYIFGRSSVIGESRLIDMWRSVEPWVVLLLAPDCSCAPVY